MIQGIAYALSACFIWGLIYIVPLFMTGFTSIEVVLGCYFFYGIVSSLMFLKSRFTGRSKYNQFIWLKAIELSLVSTIGYYSFVVLALRYASPAICTLILGISPITIAFYSNWRQREISFTSLIFPSIMILVGLVIINVPQFEASYSQSNYIIGLVCSVLALVSWSWYVVANSRFLKKHPTVRSSEWTNLIGVATIFWVALFICILFVFFEDQLQMEKYITWNDELVGFLIGSAILGILCSWVGAFLWNQASLHLPVFLAGQLTVFETIFGVSFVYLVNQTVPTVNDVIGIGTLLFAIVYGIRKFAKKKAYVNQITPH